MAHCNSQSTCPANTGSNSGKRPLQNANSTKAHGLQSVGFLFCWFVIDGGGGKDRINAGGSGVDQFVGGTGGDDFFGQTAAEMAFGQNVERKELDDDVCLG